MCACRRDPADLPVTSEAAQPTAQAARPVDRLRSQEHAERQDKQRSLIKLDLPLPPLPENAHSFEIKKNPELTSEN